MDMALLIAKSGLDAHHKNIEVISNNLANANTTAFKKNRPEFEDLPYQIMQQAGTPVSQDVSRASSVVVGTGTRLANNKKIFTDGSQIQTDNQLDIAIKGRGFLKVALPNGGEYAYTRAGNLQLNDQGQLTLSNGFVVEPQISIPPGTQHVSISQDGIITAETQGSGVQQIGQLQLSDFINPDGLLPIGQNLYKETSASGAATDGTPMSNGMGSVFQGALEGSNVNVVEEMVNLIEAQRAFELTSKAVSAVDGMLQELSRAT